jgi:carboxypeptidase Taq
MAEAVQYDVVSKGAGGRIDETEHPFTTGYYDDVRITTNYHEDRFSSSVFSVLHEAGHALYEQDLDPEWIYQPVGSGCSTGIHESQSRIVENMVGRSPEFWSYYWPKIQVITGQTFADVSLDKLIYAVNQVIPSKIRIEADEVTYSLHVIIRFNIEKRLFAGEIAAKDLPEVWNQSYRDYLSVKIENDSEGVMQDSHWSGGNFGYFPCYALGNIYDGMLLAKMDQDIPGWRKGLGNGDFSGTKEWLKKNVHCLGNLYDPPELIQKITGREPAVAPYLKYLNEKYAGLYGFKVS